MSIGCGSGTHASLSQNNITAIAVTPSSGSLPTGETQQFKAIASYANGSTSDITATAQWTTSSSSVATVAVGGSAKAVSPGTVTVTATYNGVSGSTKFTVTNKAVTNISVSPLTASIPKGTTQQFAANATYSDGSTGDVTSTATWSSSAADASISPTGLVTGMAVGSVTITASVGSVSASAPLAITTQVLTSLSMTPTTISVPAGLTQQFVLNGAYSDGSAGPLASGIIWSTGNASVATVNSAGLVTGVATGTTTLTASANGMSATAALNITAKTVMSIAVGTGTSSIADGQTAQFTATATYSDNSTADVSSTATWSTGNASFAIVSSAGLATGTGAGSTTISAMLNGMTGTAALTVTGKIVTSIAVTPATQTVADGQTAQFTATATYSDHSTANITSSATWTTSSSATAQFTQAGVATSDGQGSTTVTATLSGISGTAQLVVNAKALETVKVTPSTANFADNSNEQFAAKATYTDGSIIDVTQLATWTSSNAAVATIDTGGLATGVGVGASNIGAMFNGLSGSASIHVTAPLGTGVNIPTFHADNSRSGLNSNETTLNTSNVSASNFGKLFSILVDGYVYGTPLIMSNLTVNGATHNVLYVATEKDSVYAVDSDTGTQLWKTSLLNQGSTSNETPISGPIAPYEGVTGTPVIDANTNTLYVVSVQKASNTAAYFRLSALDITTGSIVNTTVISASVPGSNNYATQNNGIDTLGTSCIQRAALLVANGNVYIGFGGCHSGWLLAYDESSLAQVGMFDISPNNNGWGEYASAGGVWMGGGGPISDGNGNVFIVTGNGPYVPTPLPATATMANAGAWADSVLRFNSTLTLEDSFTPAEFNFMDCNDSDLAAGGLMMVPDGAAQGQLVGGGKMAKLYFLNSTNLAGSPPNSTGPDPGAIQTLEWGAAAPGQPAIANPYQQTCTVTNGGSANGQQYSAMVNSFEIFGTSAYFNGSIYLGVTPTGSGVKSGIRQFSYTSGQWVPGPDTTQYTQQNTREGTPFISANGNSEGILWMIDQGQPLQTPDPGGPTSAVLRAYDASNLSAGELYDSNQNGMSDVPGYGIKFSSPVVANGKVYISTGHDLTTATSPQGEIDVYGLN